MEYYTYVHVRLKDGSIFYVGKGKGDRCSIKQGRNKLWHNIVKADGGFDYRIVEEGLLEEEAFNLEKELIEKWNPIANMTPGGTGGDTRVKFSTEQYDEWRNKIAESNSGKVGYWSGKKRPDHSSKVKSAHQDGVYGDYAWLKKSRTPKAGKKLGWPEGKRREKIICDRCGRLISTSNIKRHQLGSKCREK